MEERHIPCTNGIVYRKTDGLLRYQGWPSVCADGDGVLYAVCSGYRMNHVCPFGKSLLFISRDQGKTWSNPIVVNDTVLDDRDTGIVWLGGKKLLITWFIHPAHIYLDHYAEGMMNACTPAEAPTMRAGIDNLENYRDQPELGGSFIRLSEDGGMTWGETIRIPVSAPHGPNVLSDGRLLYVGKQMYSDAEPEGNVAAYESTDGGHTWNRIGTIPFPEGTEANCFHEPHVIELEDGSLLAALRSEGKLAFSVYLTRSYDGGRTWSIPEATGFIGSPPHLLRHSSGAIICTYGRRTAPFGERAAVSYDGGKTWPVEYVLRDDAPHGDLGYPCTAELPDGSLFTVYYQPYAPEEKDSLLYTHWSL